MSQKYPVDKQRIGHTLLSCTRKRRYATAYAAHIERDAMEAEYKQCFGTYYCVFCHGYHIGKIPDGQPGMVR